jgi:hypothetical protein
MRKTLKSALRVAFWFVAMVCFWIGFYEIRIRFLVDCAVSEIELQEGLTYRQYRYNLLSRCDALRKQARAVWD